MANQLLETKHFFIFIFCGSSKICDKETFIYTTQLHIKILQNMTDICFIFLFPMQIIKFLL